MFQDLELAAHEGLLEAVRKTHEEMLFRPRRRARNHPHRATRMRKGMVRPAHFLERDDLRAGA
jgi:hypothetical protein